MKKILLLILLILITGCKSKELIASVESPNKEYVINAYLLNCGATCSFEVVAELCGSLNKCQEIYDEYRQDEAVINWIDNENVSINGRVLNIFKDKYDYKKDKN